MTFCIFCHLAADPSKAAVIHSDETCIIILDIHPVQPGHCLIIPRTHLDKFSDLDVATLQHITMLAKLYAPLIEAAMGAKRVGFAFVGFGVSHVHAHLIPMHSAEDLMSRAELEGRLPSPTPEELEAVKAKLTLPAPHADGFIR